MQIIVPDYYMSFKCIANLCKHTCCKGWEVEIDEESLERFRSYSDIMERVELEKEPEEGAHFRLLEGEICPFLLESGLCEMIQKYGEGILCQTCADHPRFRNYWSDRIEMGLGLVCEEAARIILNRSTPMKLVLLTENEEEAEDVAEEEIWLLEMRDRMLDEIQETGPLARLREYLIYRHIPDALYDDRLEERIRFVDYFVDKAKQLLADTDGTIDALIEIVRVLSYDLEYDEEEKDRLLEGFSKENMVFSAR